MKITLLAAGLVLAIAANEANARRLEPGQPRHCPSAWCGCVMTVWMGVPHRKDLWRARNWAKFGRPLRGPRVGAIVVWKNHVGIIVGRTAKGWVVKSGNDGNRVRARVRSLKNVIAYRGVH